MAEFEHDDEGVTAIRSVDADPSGLTLTLRNGQKFRFHATEM